MKTAEQIVSENRHMYHSSITDAVAGKSGLITIRRDKLESLIEIAQRDARAPVIDACDPPEGSPRPARAARAVADPPVATPNKVPL